MDHLIDRSSTMFCVVKLVHQLQVGDEEEDGTLNNAAKKLLGPLGKGRLQLGSMILYPKKIVMFLFKLGRVGQNDYCSKYDLYSLMWGKL